MWITFCQDVKVDKTVSILKSFEFWYTKVMEKLRTMKKKKRARKHGFLKRSKANSGKKVLKRRRLAKRKGLTV